MNLEEFEAFKLEKETALPPTIGVLDVGYQERTLAYGYTVDRHSWHLFIRSRKICCLIYDFEERAIFDLAGYRLPAELCMPDSCIYPESVDLKFAKRMRELGFELPFKNWAGAFPAHGYAPYWGVTSVTKLKVALR